MQNSNEIFWSACRIYYEFSVFLGSTHTDNILEDDSRQIYLWKIIYQIFIIEILRFSVSFMRQR